jgi:hypothetical protein
VLDFNAAFLLLVTVTFVAMFFQQWRGVAREVVPGLDNIRGKQDQGNGEETDHGWRLEVDGGGWRNLSREAWRCDRFAGPETSLRRS